MSNYNKVLLMGRLTRDPELRYTAQGTPVSDIGLAVNRKYTVGEERREQTVFVEITAWRRQAEVICQYLKKGQPLFVEGHLVMDNWQSQEGQKRSRLVVVLENFQFIGGPRRDSGDESRGTFDADDYGNNYNSPARAVGEETPAPGGSSAPDGGVGIEEGEIPF